MKLEHGKRYVMRNGDITPPVCDMRRHGYGAGQPFCAHMNDIRRHWTESGFFWIAGDESAFDIVAEYVEPQPPKWVPFDDGDRLSLLGRTIRRKRWLNNNAVLILCVSASYVGFSEWGRFHQVTYRELFDDCEFADGTPCGKLAQP